MINNIVPSIFKISPIVMSSTIPYFMLYEPIEIHPQIDHALIPFTKSFPYLFYQM